MAEKTQSTPQSGDRPFESDLMQAAGLDSLDVNLPRNVDAESAKPRVQQQFAPVAKKEPEEEFRVVRKSKAKFETTSSDMFLPFMRNPLINTIEPTYSYVVPSSFMMFYIIHEMDILMAQNYYFNRSTNLWHPYVTRLYFGILFIIQTLRAMNKIGTLPSVSKLFLTQFLDDFPPESLSIPGPLVPLFKAIAASQPNDLNLGKICPYLPEEIGPKSPNTRIQDDKSAFLWPNIPLLFGFISRITSTEAKNSANYTGTNPDVVDYPSPWNPLSVLSKTGENHTDVQPVINGVKWSSDPDAWSDLEAWSLTSPGVNFPIETSDEQNKKFTRFGSQLKVPSLAETDRIAKISDFTQLSEPEWFSKLLPIMTLYCKYFKSSDTLASCSPEGGSALKITICYEPIKRSMKRKAITRPRIPGDDDSRFPLIFRSNTTEYGINQYHQMQAHLAQLNAQVFDSHPYFPSIGSKITNDKDGPFWDIVPVSHESMRDTGYLQIADVISDHFALEKAQN